MALTQNQFGQTVTKGQVDLRLSPNIISCQVGPDSTDLVPGQCVKLVDSADGIPKITAIEADTDDVFGIVAYDIRKSTFEPGDKCEVAFFRGTVVYMEASAAIARGAKVSAVVSGSKVVTASAAKRVIGRAFDKASGNGSLIRVILDVPGLTAAAAVSFSAGSNLVGVDGTGNNAAPLTGTETRLDSIDTAITAIITNLQAAGLMA
jgi:hypothetical protein